jgi:predicted DNA-binding protein YlxM (UPF0122 family)
MANLLVESGSAPVKSGNNWRAVLITPGKGSSGVYTEEMLKEYGPKAFTKGTHSYVDHPRSEEEVRSPKNLIGVLAENARYEEGVGLVAELEIMPHWREFVEAVAPHTGLSIYAMGEGSYNDEGEVVVENLIPHTQNSVDLVSYPGRPGSKLADKLYEAAISMEYDKRKKRKKLYEELPENYRPATADDVPEGRACGNCMFFNESKLDEDGNAFCERWEEYVAGGNYCNAWKGREEASAPLSGGKGTAAKSAAATKSYKKEEYMELKELSDQIAELPNLVAAAVAEALAPAVESEEKDEIDVAAVAEAMVEADLPEVSRKAVYESLRAGGDLTDAIASQKAFVESVKSHFKEQATAAEKSVEESVIVTTEEKAPRLSEILNVKVGA